MLPLVSVIVPCYNQGQFLDEALNSVLYQTYTNWECIIINDGSEDNTEKIAETWTSKDNRFKYISITNAGVSNARNVAIQSAKGEFILPLDADDKIAEEYIKLAIQSFKDDATLKLVYCKVKRFGLKNDFWNLKTFSLKELALDNMIICSALYRKKDWEKVGGYDIKMIYGIEDWEFWISLLKNDGNVKCIDYLGFYYRIKEVSRQTELDFQRIQLMLSYINKKHAEFYIEQFGTFQYLNNKINQNEEKLASKKFVLNLFFFTFFGFTIFKKYK